MLNKANKIHKFKKIKKAFVKLANKIINNILQKISIKKWVI